MYQTNQGTIVIHKLDDIDLDLLDLIIHDGNLFRLIGSYGDHWEFDPIDWDSKLAEDAKSLIQ